MNKIKKLLSDLPHCKYVADNFSTLLGIKLAILEICKRLPVKKWAWLKTHAVIQKYLMRTVASNVFSSFDKEKCSFKNESEYDNSIWVYWDSLETMTPLVKRCLYQMKKYSNGHTVRLVTFDTVSKYVELSPTIYKRYNGGGISKTHFSDILRTNLMARYGGAYIDATTLQTSPIPEEWFEMDFFTFKVNGFPYAYTNISNAQRCVFFFVCKKNNTLMLALKQLWDAYWERFDSLIDYFLIDYFWDLCYKNIPEVKEMLDNVPESPLKALSFLGNQQKFAKETTKEQYLELIKDLDLPIIKMTAKGTGKIPEKLPNENFTLKGCIINYEV